MIVLLNLLVLVAHGAAHRALGVPLAPWQAVIVYGIIAPLPLLALFGLRRFPRQAYGLLLVVMLVGLAFGVINHYLILSPDHVAHLPPGSSRAFKLTAALLVVAELAGVGVAALGLLRSREFVGAR